MALRVAINGFGRIGRNVLRAICRDRAALRVVAINDLTDAPTLAHLLRHDSVHGRFPAEVEVVEGALRVDEHEIRVLAQPDPVELPWAELDIDVVVESTGRFRTREQAGRHLAAGARKVIISAPADDADVTVCLGVNHDQYDPEQHQIVSNASCTTNCLAPVAKVLHETLTLRKAWMTTVHSYTNAQRILDLPHKDLRRARAAALSMIPTSTGAARAVGSVLPELRGRIDGFAVRVPTPDVSLVDLVAQVERRTSAAEVNDPLRSAAEGPLRGILGVSDEPLVSIDYTGNTLSAVVDAEFTRVLDGDLVHVVAWYDNEMGYSTRLKDLIEFVGERL